MNRVFHGSRSGLVGLTPDESSLHASTGNQAGVAVWPVIATIVAVPVARRADAAFWTTSKLADRQHQGVLQQSTIIEVRDQTGQASIQHRTRLVFHTSRQSDVNVE